MKTSKILKYIKGTTSLIEIKEIENWINASSQNTKKYNLIKAEYLISSFDETTNSTDIEKPLKKYLDNTVKLRRKKLLRKSLKYAASITILLSSGYYLYNNTQKTIPEVIIPKNAITLTLENGNTQIIKENGTIQVINHKGDTIGEQKGSKLSYTKSTNLKKLTYNTLTVPYGKKFDLVLSDNTHVFLNSGTSLKYPINFIKGQSREVFLKGEAFFEVAKDKEHPFVVKAKDLNIRVLGTKFNVSAYPEDFTTNTVLVEGSVGVYQEEKYLPKKATMLKPGHLASLDRNHKSISLEKVDVSLYISWMNGSITFKHEPFKNILKKLERQYDVSISNTDKKLDEIFFTASFEKNASLDYILKTFHENYGIQYTINDTNITINH